MWMNFDNDDAAGPPMRATRIVHSPVAGHFVIATDGREWFAYPNDDYSNKTGMICIVTDTEEKSVASARKEGVCS